MNGGRQGWYGLVGSVMYQSRPPERGEVVLKAPNMNDSTFVDTDGSLLEESTREREMGKDDKV